MKKNQPHIGVLGLGSRSTVFYIEQLNNKYQALKGGYSTCPFKLLNANFNTINPFLPDNFEQLEKNLLPYLQDFQKLNIDTLLIPNITLHQTIDLLTDDQRLKTPIIHPLESTLGVLKNDGKNEVLLLGSLHTMRTSYIPSHLKANNIVVSVPKEKEMLFIDNLRQNIYLNKETQEEINEYKQLIQIVTTNKAVVIACTELSLVLPDNMNNVYDMARIQINKALNVFN